LASPSSQTEALREKWVPKIVKKTKAKIGAFWRGAGFETWISVNFDSFSMAISLSKNMQCTLGGVAFCIFSFSQKKKNFSKK
jgi:hypothetical protein